MKFFVKKIILLYCICSLQTVFAQNDDADIQTVYFKNDSTISFVLFIPGNTKNNLKDKPAFFFFEPWGNGYYPVSKYKSLAEKYDVALIGFNASRNGMSFEESNASFSIALEELKSRYDLNPNFLSLVGFSGGGKVAVKVAAAQPFIPYVIYGGSVIEENLSGKQVLGFAGTTDMNYINLTNYDIDLNKQSNVRHSIIEYEGPHAWFDTTTMENAFIWLKLNLMRDKKTEKDTSFIRTIINNYEQKINTVVTDKKWMDAYKQINALQYLIKNLWDTKWLDDKKVTLEKTSAFKKEIKQQQIILDTEKQTKSNYVIYIFSRDTAWWRTEVNRLREKTSPVQAYSNKRLLGSIFAYCYYFSNDAFEQNNLIGAEKILNVFHIAFPGNPEQAFLRAVLWAKKNNPAISDEIFNEAKKAGFIEWDKSTGETILQYFRRRPLK